MKIRFVGQPFERDVSLLDFIINACDSNFQELKIAVAWAKQSGLSRIWKQLIDFRARGGKLTLIVGVSEGGATVEGLRAASAIADSVYVFHDPRRTFHPKVYYASSPRDRSLFVGSSNLTAGGLSWNYEASMWIDWEMNELQDLTQSVSSWFSELLSKSNSCSPLTDELIDKMRSSDDITIASEASARRVQTKKIAMPEDDDSMVTASITGLFKPVTEGLKKLPRVSADFPSFDVSAPMNSIERVADADKSAARPAARVPEAGDSAPSIENVERRWIKKLDSTAAQQVRSPRSNPTGNLRLSQVDAQIDHKHYFRSDFFGGLPWIPRDNRPTEQEVMVGFHTWIDGIDLGFQELRISHDKTRIAGQGNVPTLLHWGVLSKMLRETNYIGHYVALEKTSEGTYNLIISREPRGPYLV